MSDNEIRPMEEVQRDQIVSGTEPAPAAMPSLPHHETVKADSQTVGEIHFPEEEDFEHEVELLEREVGSEFEEEEFKETPIRIVPQAVIYFRAQENELQHLLLDVRRHTEGEQVFDLLNPLASGKRKGKAHGNVGILRDSVSEFFKYLGMVINQNAVFIGEPEQLDGYLDRLFQRVEHRLAELLYGEEMMLISETYSIEKVELFSSSISLAVEQNDDEAVAYVNISINVHVAQLLATVEKAESVLRNYMKYLVVTFRSAGIETVNSGVVFNVEDFANPECNAFNVFNLLVGRDLAVKPSDVISQYTEKGLDHEFAFQGKGNVLVMLETENETPNEV